MEFRLQVEGIEDAMRQLDGVVSPARLRQGLAAAAFYVEGAAKVKAPIDFGFLANSIYTVTASGSGYAEATNKAKARNPNAEMLPQESINSTMEAVIAAGAEYAIYQEMGTRFMRAQPFMRPALENNRERIAQIIRDALQRGVR